MAFLAAIWWQRGRRWLLDERDPITWATLRARLTLTTLPLPRTNVGRLGVGVLLLLALLWYASGQPDDKGVVTYPHANLINPILGGLGALLLIYAAIRQARTATEQAETSRKRHEAQTKADLQRRITESFSKAIEQLGSDKLEVRLGGIYALERISQESDEDYWTVMENLTAFVRERTQRTEAEWPLMARDQRISARAYLLWEKAGRPEGRSEEFWREAARLEKDLERPATDIATVMTVISRRSEHHRTLETRDERRFDFSRAILRWANLAGAHLEGSDLSWAHLQSASLSRAHLQGAFLSWAHLEGASFRGAHLEGADLSGAHLQGATLRRTDLKRAFLTGAFLQGADLKEANLERAFLQGAHLEGADLSGAHLQGATLATAHLEQAALGGAQLEGIFLNRAHLEGADLSRVEGLTQERIDPAYGDAATKLPEGLTRPAHWTQPAPGAAPAA
jgi:uncharacterized protein YjbI with pentapeptide repeats